MADRYEEILRRFNAIRGQLADGDKAASNVRAEKKFLEHEQNFAQQQLQRLIDENQARKVFSQAIFTVTVIWMFFILLVVVACGHKRMELSDSVLIALITTTTANIFGFFYVVVNYLFNKDKST